MKNIDTINNDKIIDSVFFQLTNELVYLLRNSSYLLELSDITDRCQTIAEQTSYALSLYYSARDRKLSPKKREVHISSIFQQKLSSESTSEQKAAIRRIIDLSHQGVDLSPYQSTGVSRLETNFQNQDKLFNDWNIMHFHLGIGKPAIVPGFKNRSDTLIIAYSKPEALYFIDLRPHGSETWLDRELLEIINKEWPSVLEDSLIPGAQNASIQAIPDIVQVLRGESSAQKKTAKKAGAEYTFAMSYPIELSDRRIFIPPGGGLASNGMRTSVGMRSDHVMRTLVQWVRSNDLRRKDQISAHFRGKKLNPQSTIELSIGLAVHDLWNVRLEIFDRKTAKVLYSFRF